MMHNEAHIPASPVALACMPSIAGSQGSELFDHYPREFADSGVMHMAKIPVTVGRLAPFLGFVECHYAGQISKLYRVPMSAAKQDPAELEVPHWRWVEIY